MHLLIAALQWDPQIRGALIVITAILILPGSVYLLLATNTGARLGLMLAIAGLSGWMAIMGVVWMVFGIGLKGREPHWEPKELITGSLNNRATVEAMKDFPNGKWDKLTSSDKVLADATSAADRVLAPSTAPQPGREAEAPDPEVALRFQTPFKQPTDYVVLAGYDKGGDNEVFTIKGHKFYLRHSPHYVVVQVQPVLEQETPAGGAPPTPEADPSKPVTTLIMVRDLGSVRFPPFLVALASLLVFGVTCSALHERDKEIMRARGQIPATA